MPIIHPYIFEMIKEFPDKKRNILGLHTNSYAFRTMCEDLGKCKKAYQYWSQSESKNAKVLSEEYRQLLENLEDEIDRYLTENYTEQLRSYPPEKCQP